MAEAETLLKMLESVMHSHTAIVEALTRLEERQQEHNLALAEAIGANSRLLAKGIAENSKALAEILERVVQTTSRTEQMTARILTEVAGSASH